MIKRLEFEESQIRVIMLFMHMLTCVTNWQYVWLRDLALERERESSVLFSKRLNRYSCFVWYYCLKVLYELILFLNFIDFTVCSKSNLEFEEMNPWKNLIPCVAIRFMVASGRWFSALPFILNITRIDGAFN